MIEIKKLCKKYGGFLALDNCDLVANSGEITVILGPNGAGKSTLIKSLCSLLNYSGEILIDGIDNHDIKAKSLIAYIPEVPNLYDNLNLLEHCQYLTSAYNIPLDEEYLNTLIECLELNDKVKVPTKELSKGMKQKASIILALIIKPKALVVDEPMIGLDPKAIETVLNIFKKLKEEGVAILISTHIIDIMEGNYDVAYIMDHGLIKAKISKDDEKSNNLKQLFFEITEGSNNA